MDGDKKSEEEEPVATEATEATDRTQPEEDSDKDLRQEALHNIQSEKCIVFFYRNFFICMTIAVPYTYTHVVVASLSQQVVVSSF